MGWARTIPRMGVGRTIKSTEAARRDDLARKTHFLVALAGILLFLAGLATPFQFGLAFTLWSAVSVGYCIYTTVLLTVWRLYLFAGLAIFLTYGVATVWAVNYALGWPMSSWRAGWETRTDFTDALGHSLLYLTFFSVLCVFVVSRAPKPQIGPRAPLEGDRYQLAVTLLTVGSAFSMVAIAGTRGRDEYLITADLGSMFLVQASSILMASLFAFALFYLPSGMFRRLVIATLAGAALLVGMNGFRFLLIIFALVWLFYILATRRIPLSRAILLAAAGTLGYIGLLCLAYTRTLGLTTGQVFEFLLSPDLDAALAYVGAADQVNMVALDYFTDRARFDEALSGRTYLDAFLRLAPNFVHTSLFETIRGQDYIVQTGTFVPEQFRENNWTVGSHLFVEAVINFGRLGPYLVLSVVVAVLAWLTRLSRTSPTLFLGCLVTAAMGYSLAWYGFANSLKQGVFAFVCCLIIARVTGPWKRDQSVSA